MGEYDPVAARLMPASRALAAECGIAAGQEVLDVAAGTGNLAVVAASQGAAVTATDLAPVMVERGAARSAAEGFDIDWQEADAEELPFPDGSFDCVASVFGACFAPRADVVASELFRVVRPGGVVGLTAWTPDGFAAKLFMGWRKYLPVAADAEAPEEWAREEVVRARLEPHAASVHFEKRKVDFEASSVEEFARIFESAPAGEAARTTLGPEVWEEIRRVTREAVTGANEATDGGARVPFEYGLMVARRHG
ncbi:MAG: class I SAM-dependent methyltransferase [Thermoleophilaceae bacterium]|nr:class I SAM-dependent methyltransferase [Thermoleophilaceae bacterium]